jgi:ATP-dependent helicase YprA (DUF1998 family)
VRSRGLAGHTHHTYPHTRTQTAFDQGGLHAIEHVLCSLAPLEVMCDPNDLSCQHTRRETDLHRCVRACV